MHFYHYTSRSNWHLIQHGDSKDRTGLVPRRRFITLNAHTPGVPEKATDSAVFGLLDPLDTAWCKAAYMPYEPLLQTVLGDINTRTDKGRNELYLLEVALTPNDDAYVADHGPHMRPDYDGNRGENRKVVHEVKTAYWNSLIPFADYVRRGGGHEVPEVVCFTPIPRERVKLKAIYNAQHLENEIRVRGGFAPYPIRPKPKPINGDKVCELLGIK